MTGTKNLTFICMSNCSNIRPSSNSTPFTTTSNDSIAHLTWRASPSALSMNPLWTLAVEAMQNAWEDTQVGSMEVRMPFHRVVNNQFHNFSHWHPGGVHQNDDTRVAALLHKVPCRNTPCISGALVHCTLALTGFCCYQNEDLTCAQHLVDSNKHSESRPSAVLCSSVISYTMQWKCSCALASKAK